MKPVKAPDIISRIQLHVQLANLKNVQESQEDVFAAKGISKRTLALITDYLQDKKEASSVDDISKEIGLAYPTVYRYIIHLLEEGKVKQEITHQKIGRPKKFYKWYTN